MQKDNRSFWMELVQRDDFLLILLVVGLTVTAVVDAIWKH